MSKGKQAGYITYDELNKHLPPELVSADRVEQIINVFTEMGIKAKKEVSPPDQIEKAPRQAGRDDDRQAAPHEDAGE